MEIVKTLMVCGQRIISVNYVSMWKIDNGIRMPSYQILLFRECLSNSQIAIARGSTNI